MRTCAKTQIARWLHFLYLRRANDHALLVVALERISLLENAVARLQRQAPAPRARASASLEGALASLGRAVAAEELDRQQRRNAAHLDPHCTYGASTWLAHPPRPRPPT